MCVFSRDVPDKNFKIWPEPNQMNYLAGTCCITIFGGFLCCMNKKCIIAHACFSALCAYALHRSSTIICKRVSIRDSLTTRVQVTCSLNALHYHF